MSGHWRMRSTLTFATRCPWSVVVVIELATPMTPLRLQLWHGLHFGSNVGRARSIELVPDLLSSLVLAAPMALTVGTTGMAGVGAD